jgi:hypothetical protein
VTKLDDRPIQTLLSPSKQTVRSGWYPDPQGSTDLKYWDGEQWRLELIDYREKVNRHIKAMFLVMGAAWMILLCVDGLHTSGVL